jgi:hypothetical protein
MGENSMKMLLGVLLAVSLVSADWAEARDRDRDGRRNRSGASRDRNRGGSGARRDRNRDRNRNNNSGTRVRRRSSDVDGYRPSRDGSVSGRRRNGNGNTHRDRNRNNHGNTHRDRNRNGNRHGNTHRDRNRNGNRYGSGGTNVGLRYRNNGRRHRHARYKSNWRKYHRRATYHRRHGHRPHWNRPGIRYSYYRHRAYNYSRRHNLRFRHWRDYHRTIPFKFIYWGSWIRYRMSVNDGFVWRDGYPYFAYNGYLHRYSNWDKCEYALVDGYNNTTVRTYGGYCATAYDRCADRRDDKNYDEYGYRYFCSEKFDYEDTFDYDWDYDDSFYSDTGDYDDDFYDWDY